MKWNRVIALSCLCITLGACSVPAQDSKSPAAVVNGQPVAIDVVHHFLDRTLQHLPNAPERTGRSAEIINHGIRRCVDREVILQHLQSGKFKTLPGEIDLQMEELESQLVGREKNLQQFLEQIRLSESQYRRELLWRTTWRRYVKEFVTDEHLKKQFERKKKYFDGTKYHVAQILWKQHGAETLAKAATVKRRLVSGELDWNTAVAENSESASAKRNGDLGWISYSGPMPRSFTQAAFELETGGFSDPLTSQYGVHLIHCQEISKGTRSFEDVSDELREFETNRLFELVAKRHRPNAQIEIFE